MTTLYDYRIAEYTYINRVVNEDGPGSTQNVVSDTYVRVIREWFEMDEDFAQHLVKNPIAGLYIEQDSADGFHVYSYYIERRPAEGGEWRFIDTLDQELYNGKNPRW